MQIMYYIDGNARNNRLNGQSKYLKYEVGLQLLLMIWTMQYYTNIRWLGGR